MFSRAYEMASQYTIPIISSTRSINGMINSNLGAYVVINNQGWILTVAHMFNDFFKSQKDQPELTKYTDKVQQIQNDTTIPPKIKNKRINKIPKDNTWITHQSLWFGQDGVKLEESKIFGELDLAIGRLEPFDPNSIRTYPKIINPANAKYGTSLCKLGYPFHNLNATFDEVHNTFKYSEENFPIPRFPIEGIYTRDLLGGKTTDGMFDIKFLETSSPGFKGQSGGPIFDINGNIWAIQSRTTHLALGFSPIIERNGKKIEENQFINVGLGVHCENIIKILNESNVEFELS